VNNTPKHDIGDVFKKWGQDLSDDLKKETERIKEELWLRFSSMSFDWLDQSRVENHEQTWVPKNDLASDQCYVEIKVKTMHIPYQRVFTKRFFGAVHSFISLNSNNVNLGGKASFNSVTTPALLQNVDPKNMDKVVQSDVRVLGPVPFRDDVIDIEVGVFSVQEDDLLAPFLKIVEEMSNTAGVSIVSKALPFVSPIENAIYNLIGYSQNNKLEVGLKTNLRREGYLVVVGSENCDFSKLYLKNDGKLVKKVSVHADEQPLQEAYMVLTVKSVSHRSNWREIPELLKAFNDLLVLIKSGNKESVKDFFERFKKDFKYSSELIIDDSDQIIAEISKKYVEPALQAPELKIVKTKPQSIDLASSMKALEKIKLPWEKK
jgi:hypothetical protein